MNMPEIVAHSFRPEDTDEIVCTDPLCVIKYADLMATTGRPLTQDDVQQLQDNRDGESIYCASCGEPLDRWTASMGTSAAEEMHRLLEAREESEMTLFRIVRQAARDAWTEMWAWPFFRAVVYFDAVIISATAAVLAISYKIGLIK
jgi:hypothetical protein